jgi:hypothetical protein
MRFRNTVIVLILLVVVGGYAAWTAFFDRGPDEVHKLYDITPDAITKIALKYPDREVILERDSAGKWMLAAPIKTEADQTAANNLATAIANCDVKKKLEGSAADLAPYGLDKPEVIVTVTAKKKGVLPGIEVGKVTPIGFSAYIKTTDKPGVMLTASAFPAGMKKKPDDLRSRELMSFKVDDVNKLTIEREGEPAIELIKDHDTWKIVKPAPYAADSAQVRTALGGLANATVASFIEDSPAGVSRYSLERPRLTATVHLAKDGSQQSLLFGGKESGQGKSGTYVRRGERAPVYTVAGYVFSDANQSLFDLRDKTVLGIDPAQIERVGISSGGKTFTLQRTAPGKWQIDAGTKTDADATVVDRFLDQIKSLKGQSIVEDPIRDPKKLGLDKPTQDIALSAKDGKHLGSLALVKIERRNEDTGASPSPQRVDYYAASSASNAAYTIDDFSFGQLIKTAEQFRSQSKPSPSPSTAPSPSK